MDIQNDKYYLKKDLMAYLKGIGVASTYPTILKYERMGVIPSPRRTIEGFKINWRLYKGSEIKKIGRILSKTVV